MPFPNPISFQNQNEYSIQSKNCSSLDNSVALENRMHVSYLDFFAKITIYHKLCTVPSIGIQTLETKKERASLLFIFLIVENKHNHAQYDSSSNDAHLIIELSLLEQLRQRWRPITYESLTKSFATD